MRMTEALSGALRGVKLDGAVFLDAHFRDPWCIVARGKFARVLMPAADHFIHYHFMVEGSCRVRLEDDASETRMQAGDLIVFPQGDPHVMGSNLSLAPRSLADILPRPVPGEVARVEHGGSGTRARLVCGFLACDAQLCRPILSALPRVFTVNMRGTRSGEWLESSLRHSVAEAAAPRAGADVVLARLSEALFAEAVRAYAESLPPEGTGWLAGMRDPCVGRALELIHSRYAEPWTVATLAREAGCSRSVLSERFVHYLGQPPIQYLTSWRLRLAASLLRSDGSLARIAARVGYESDAAFSRAFRREFGVPPAKWRRRPPPQRGASGPG